MLFPVKVDAKFLVGLMLSPKFIHEQVTPVICSCRTPDKIQNIFTIFYSMCTFCHVFPGYGHSPFTGSSRPRRMARPITCTTTCHVTTQVSGVMSPVTVSWPPTFARSSVNVVLTVSYGAFIFAKLGTIRNISKFSTIDSV